jgi:hypothetical protein
MVGETGGKLSYKKRALLLIPYRRNGSNTVTNYIKIIIEILSCQDRYFDLWQFLLISTADINMIHMIYKES